MTKIAFKIGDSQIHAVVHQKRSPLPTMINVHDDENTAVEAGKANIDRHGGRLIELVHSGERRIRFNLNGQEFLFDPNRIFSDAGITATLKKHSSYSEAAHAAIKCFAKEYLLRFALDQESVIIALHNTVDGIFSVESFGAKGDLGSNTAEIFVSPQRSKFDFFYVTEKEFYNFLKDLDFNVVLQDNEHATDDGSLSVYFARMKIPYINVEAEINHLANQIEMLEVVREMLNEAGWGNF